LQVSAIIRAIEAALTRLNQGVHAVRVAPPKRRCDRRAPWGALSYAVFQSLPRVPPSRSIESAAGPRWKLHGVRRTSHSAAKEYWSCVDRRPHRCRRVFVLVEDLFQSYRHRACERFRAPGLVEGMAEAATKRCRIFGLTMTLPMAASHADRCFSRFAASSSCRGRRRVKCCRQAGFASTDIDDVDRTVRPPSSRSPKFLPCRRPRSR